MTKRNLWPALFGTLFAISVLLAAANFLAWDFLSVIFAIPPLTLIFLILAVVLAIRRSLPTLLQAVLIAGAIALIWSIAFMHWPLKARHALSVEALENHFQSSVEQSSEMPAITLGSFRVQYVDTEKFENASWYVIDDRPCGLIRLHSGELDSKIYAYGKYFIRLDDNWLFFIEDVDQYVRGRRTSPIPAGQKYQLSLDGGTWLNGNPSTTNNERNIRLINFWGHWCVPCMAEIPHLIEIHEKYAGQGVDILGICPGGEKVREPTLAAIERASIPWPCLIDADPLIARHGVKAYPTTMIINRDGTVAKTFVGKVGKAALEEVIKPLIKTPTEASP